jgi:hypothetical protein
MRFPNATNAFGDRVRPRPRYRERQAGGGHLTGNSPPDSPPPGPTRGGDAAVTLPCVNLRRERYAFEKSRALARLARAPAGR